MKRFTAILAIVLCLCTLVNSMGALAYAEVSKYTSVSEDLNKDESFDASAYPYVRDDYSLQVITIAESSDDELFVYVYQPGGEQTNVTANLLHMSQGKDNVDYKVYRLTKIDSNGVFYKYRVEDFEIEDIRLRYYNITAIYRPFISGVDKQATGDNEITSVPFDVSRSYALGVESGKFVTNVSDVETITVTTKYVGFVRYYGGFTLIEGMDVCDSHFVAFDTDKPIDELIEAKVYYRTQSYEHVVTTIDTKNTFGNKVDNYAELTNDQDVAFDGKGLISTTFTWKRIQTVSQFIANVENEKVYSCIGFDVNVTQNTITDEAKEQLKDKKWVLRFAETDYSYTAGNGSNVEKSTIVGDVSILRLMFKTDGKIYNLGVVDNHQSGSTDPINKPGGITITPNNKGWNLLAVVLGVILVIAILNVVVRLVGYARDREEYRYYKRRNRR